MDLKNLFQIIEAIQKNIVLLPHFQREYVWNKTQQKNLILSVLTNLPSSSSLLLRKQNTDKFKCIRIGMRSEVIENANENDAYYLLDGQQRYTTSFYAFNFVFEEDTTKKNKELYTKIDNKLNKIWYLNLIDEGNYLLGFKNLIWEEQETKELLPEDIDSFLEFKVIKKSDVNSKDVMITNIINTCKEDLNKPMIPLFMLRGHNKLKHLLRTFFDNRLNEIKLHENNKSILIEILYKTGFNQTSDKTIEEAVDLFYNSDKGVIDKIEKHIDEVELKESWLDGVCDFFKTQINNYEILPIMMEDRNKAVKTFEYINRGGTNLNSFDLLCAKVPNFDLRAEVIKCTSEPFKWFNKNGSTNNSFELIEAFGLLGDKNDQPSIEKKYAEYLSQVLNLIHWKENGKYPDDQQFNTQILKSSYSLDKLDEAFITDNYLKAVEIIKKSGALLQVFAGHGYLKNITNNLSLIQIFTYFIYEEDDDYDLVKIKKVLNLFWLSLFTGRFDSHQNQHAIENAIWVYKLIFKNDTDIKDKLKIDLNEKLLNVEEFATEEMLTTQKCNQSIENNIFNYIRSCKAKFLDWDKPASSTKIEVNTVVDIHHIIPLYSATKIGESTRTIRKDNNHYLNATMNKTLISSEANKTIGAKSVNAYHTDLNQYNTQFSYHYIDTSWSTVDLRQENDIKELFKIRYNSIKQSITTTIDSSLFSD